MFRIRHTQIVKLQTVGRYPLKSNLNFLKYLDSGKAFGWLPHGFKRLFLAEEPLASQHMTENLLS